MEYTMLAEGAAKLLPTDVLKIGHHGSKNSTMSGFLAAVVRQITLVSLGLTNPAGVSVRSVSTFGRVVQVLLTDTVGDASVDGRTGAAGKLR